MSSGGEEALRQQYVIGDEIGRGRFGTVRRCYAAATGEALAVKSTAKAPLREADPLDLALAEQEPMVHLLASAPPASPHVVALHAAFEDADAVHLVLDLCEGGDLFSLISARGRLPEPEAADLTAQLAAALATCHLRGVVHRDVKPDNVLFDAGGVLKLGDFGSAEWFGDGRPMTGLVGTPYYVAPEVVAGREYNEKVDVWSAGVVLYMMLSGTVPFYGATAAEIFESVLRGNLRFPPRAFASVSPEAKDLTRRMLCKDVSRRFSADQVLRRAFVMLEFESFHLSLFVMFALNLQSMYSLLLAGEEDRGRQTCSEENGTQKIRNFCTAHSCVASVLLVINYLCFNSHACASNEHDNRYGTIPMPVMSFL